MIKIYIVNLWGYAGIGAENIEILETLKAFKDLNKAKEFIKEYEKTISKYSRDSLDYEEIELIE